jgi:3-phenylpropionate/trans-cinnamate dioxygenase ferredoxin reductase subunit
VKEILVVGANVAGVSVATTLRSEGFAGIVRLIDAEPHLPYERPPLSKGALSAAPFSATLLRDESFYHEMSLDLILGRRVVSFSSDLKARLDDGSSLRPDAVVLATGARARRLAVEGGDDPRVTTLRTRDDAARIFACLTPGAKIVVIGGGLIGAEVAATAQERGCDVTWIERRSKWLHLQLGHAMAAACVAHHRRLGVKVIASAEVASIDTGVSLGVRLHDGRRLPAELVVVGVGVEAEVGLAIEAGIDVDDGVLVDAAGRTRNPSFFAVGDVARVRGSPRREHWQRAIDQGSNAARALLGRETAPPEVPWFWSDQFDRHIEVAGDLSIADQEVVRGEPTAANGSIFALRNGCVVGVATCNRPREARAAMRLIRAGKPVRPGDLADDRSDLRQLTFGGAS